jgi:AcrR family transcriptional regulator
MPKANAQLSPAKAQAGEVTRSRLLVAASSLIVERGWGSVTTRAVAERAGVNQALVHYHFGTMEALLTEAAVARMMPEVRALIDELLDDRPIPESLHRVMALMDRFDLGSELGVLMAEAMLQATRDERVAEAMGGVIGSWAELLEPRIAVAQERGVVRDDVHPASLARIIAAMLDGFLIQRMADPGLDADRAADTLIQLLSPAAKEGT